MGRMEGEDGTVEEKCRKEKKRVCFHCTTQQPPLPPPCDAYGSSFFATGPHTDGTCDKWEVSKHTWGAHGGEQ